MDQQRLSGALAGYGSGSLQTGPKTEPPAAPQMGELLSRALMIRDQLAMIDDSLFATWCRLQGPRPREAFSQPEKVPEGEMWQLLALIEQVSHRVGMLQGAAANFANL